MNFHSHIKLNMVGGNGQEYNCCSGRQFLCQWKLLANGWAHTFQSDSCMLYAQLKTFEFIKEADEENEQLK